MLETIFTYDIDKFSPELLKAIAEKQVIFRDGVAYWVKGAKETGIIQHIPLKEVASVTQEGLQQSLNAMQSTLQQSLSTMQSALQNTIVVTQAISSATLLVATVIQTQILSKKIEEVQSAVLEVSNDIKEQNTVFYMDKVSRYLGHLQTLKMLLAVDKDDLLNTTNHVANNLLSSSIQDKNYIIAFIHNSLGLIQSNQVDNQEHAKTIMTFVQHMMELLPLGMHFEFLVSHRLNQKQFSQQLIMDSNTQYSSLLGKYKSYLNEISRGLDFNKITLAQVPFFEKISQPAKDLIKGGIYVELLEKPANEKISYAENKQQNVYSLL